MVYCTETPVNCVNIKKVRKFILDNHQISVHEILQAYVSIGIVEMLINARLCFWKISAKLVLKFCFKY